MAIAMSRDRRPMNFLNLAFLWLKLSIHKDGYAIYVQDRRSDASLRYSSFFPVLTSDENSSITCLVAYSSKHTVDTVAQRKITTRPPRSNLRNLKHKLSIFHARPPT